MVAILRRMLLAPIVLLNLLLYVVLVAISSWALNKSFDYGFVEGGNGITITFVILSLIAGVVGIASVLAGLHHLSAWRTDSFAAAGAAGLIAWLLTLLAFGVACKHISRGHIESQALRALEAIVIIVAATQWLYLLMLHAGFMGSRLGGYREPGHHHRSAATTSKEVPVAATSAADESAQKDAAASIV